MARLLALVSVAAIVLVAIEGEMANGIGEIAGVMVLAALLVALLERVATRTRDDPDAVRSGVRLLPDRVDVQVLSTGHSTISATRPVFGEAVDRSVFSYFSFTTLTTSASATTRLLPTSPVALP